MGYFDDPKHRAQWEKELSALRQEKARIKAGASTVSGQAEHTVSKNAEKVVPENEFVSEERLDRAPRKTAIAHDAPEKQANAEPAKVAVSEDIRTAKPAADAETKKTAAAERKVSPKPAAERARHDGAYRVRISFEELLRAENMYTPPKLTQKPREPERQKEVSHVL